MQKTPQVLQEYQSLVAARLRLHETRKAGNDDERLKDLADMSDAELLRKWMWLTVIVAGPACYIVVPLILSVFSTFLPLLLMGFLWIVAKTAMGMVFILFLLSIYFTVNVKSNE